MLATNRREFLKKSTVVGAALTTALATEVQAGETPGAEGKDRFKIGILFGDNPAERPPAELAPGYEVGEMPISLQVLPFDTNAAWARKRAEFASWKNLPPIKVTSHFINPPIKFLTGPEADDELLDLWMRRTFPRLAQVGVEAIGVYGHFWVAEAPGLSQTQARDQALTVANRIADYAKQYKMVIALEPMGDPKTLWPLYKDGIAFAKQTGRPEIRVMADTAYFMQYNQSLEDIASAPEYLVHCQTSGAKMSNGHLGQPGVGNMVDFHTRFFTILRRIGYKGAVSCACAWVDTTGSGKMQFGVETAKTLQYLRGLRDKVYSRG
jgi:sugar phosphate isomerase/epimerase